MREAVHTIMRVLMRAWFHDVVDALGSAPRARGVPQAHASGLDPDRILVFGNGLAAGWGVATHELAIPGELARALATMTGRGADIDVSAHVDLKVARASGVLEKRKLAGYDAIVVIIGASDALSLTPRRQWRTSMRSLIETILDRTSASASVLVVEQMQIRAVPPFDNLFGQTANAHAVTLNGITRELCDEYPRTKYVSLPALADPATERLGTPERFRIWGNFLARRLAPRLNDAAWAPAADARPTARTDRNRPQPDEERYATLDRLDIIRSGRDEEIDRIVTTARTLFGTQGAAFTLIGRDRQWHKSIVGADIADIPLELSLCIVTIRGTAPLVVSDVHDDSRFSPDSPMAFYAGYPIESPDGQRIGALCVFDSRPRNPSLVDPAILRDLALLVQEQLWRYPRSSGDTAGTEELPPQQ